MNDHITILAARGTFCSKRISSFVLFPYPPELWELDWEVNERAEFTRVTAANDIRVDGDIAMLDEGPC